ncbi:hypothetical protein BB561_005496 [Smittium simulii]|uniref:Uncharacterized protein n=1 Tax=Smittium simulii TaxID=133385 RepID=A0A2T9YA25_9FUNG|nr:hypothetical protein BB561_005496 [Smittium simulii]
MGKNTIRIIQDLANLVNELCMSCSNLNQKADAILHNRKIHMFQEEKHEPMIVEPHNSTNMSVTYLEVYPEPIDLFVYQKLLNNPEILPEDNNIVFAHTIRVLLSDLTTTMSQLRIDTLHREMNLSAKSPQISEPEKEPLFEPEAFNELPYSGGGFAQAQQTQDTASNKQQSFCGWGRGRAKEKLCISALASRRRANLNPEKPMALTKKNFISSRGLSAKQLIPENLNIFCKEKQLNSATKNQDWNKIWSTIGNTSVSVHEETIPKSKKSVDGGSFCSISKESNRGSENKKTWILQPTEGLHDFPGSGKCIYAYPNSSVVKKIPEPTYLHQNFVPSIGIGEITENMYFDILGQSLYYRGNKKKLNLNSQQLPQRKKSQFRNGINLKKITLKVSTANTRDLRRKASKLIKAEKTFLRGLESFIGKEQTMSVDLLLGRLILRLLLELKSRALSRSDTSSSNTSWEIVDGSRFYFGLWIPSEALIQYYYAFILKKSRGYDFTHITLDNRKYLGIMLINKYLTTSDLVTVDNKSKDAPSRPQGSRPKCINIQLEIVSKPILISTLEPKKTSDQKAVTGLLRSSNIHRIDDARTHITNGTLYLVIIAPKEKRGGQIVERPCQIAEHSNPIMRPVMEYREYKNRVAQRRA